MKKDFFILAIALGVAAIMPPAKAQNLSFFGAVGYAFGRGGNDFTTSTTYTNGGLVKKEDHYLSIGQGLKIDGGLHIPFGKSFELRLAGGYSKMSALEAETIQQSSNVLEKYIYNASFFHFEALAIVIGDLGAAKFYTGAGGGLFFAEESRAGSFTDFTFPIKFEDKVEFRFNPAVGLVAVAGFKLPLAANNLCLFAEAHLEQVSFLPTEFEYVQYKINGEDALSTIDVNRNKAGRQTKLEYEKNSTEKRTPFTFQGSSFGLRTGLQIGW
jgi:hypothetical protein